MGNCCGKSGQKAEEEEIRSSRKTSSHRSQQSKDRYRKDSSDDEAYRDGISSSSDSDVESLASAREEYVRPKKQDPIDPNRRKLRHINSGELDRMEDLDISIPVDFSGDWVLDRKRSDPLEEILKAQGRNWAERKAANNLTGFTRSVSMSGSELTMTLNLPLGKKKTEKISTDGKEHRVNDDHLGSIETKSVWEGDKLVTTLHVNLPSGPAVWITSRYLENMDTLVQEHHLTLKSGEVLTASRYLTRKSGRPSATSR